MENQHYRWKQVHIRHEMGGFAASLGNFVLFDTDESMVVAKSEELALTPVNNEPYITGKDAIDGYRFVSSKELFELADTNKYVFMLFELVGVKHQPVKLINKVIIKWKN